MVNNILGKLCFHALSLTLLATVAHHNKWDINRLVSEWEERRTEVLKVEDSKSLAAAIELSLSIFQDLGPDARELLGVDEKNIDRLFPTIASRKNIFNKFCVLSLTYRNDSFITMLAPIRGYLSPKDPTSALLLRYFSRLSIDVEPGRPGFEEARRI